MLSSSWHLTSHLLAVWFIWGAPGCTVLADADRVQCSVKADCTRRGPAFADTRCEDHFCVAAPSAGDEDSTDGAGDEDSTDGADNSTAGSPPSTDCNDNRDCTGVNICVDKRCIDPFVCEATPASDGAINVSVPVTDVLGNVLAGVPVRLCRNLDPQCQNPVSELVTDEQGVLSVELPAAFTGYLEFVLDPYFPQLQVLPATIEDGETLPPVTLSPTEVIYGLGLAVGAAPDPERGHIHFTILNCFGPARGVEIASNGADENSHEYYVLAGVPSRDLTETTAEGSAGFLNFPPGNTAVSLTASDTHKELGKLSFVVRPGFVTMATLQLTVGE